MTLPKLSRSGSRQLAMGLALAFLAAGAWILPACSAQGDAKAESSDDSGVLATIGESEITRGEVETEAKDELAQVEMQKLQCEANYERSKHQVYETVVQRMVRDRLVEEAAAAKDMTKEEFLAAEVDAKVAEVTDAAIDAFYEQNRERIPQPKEQVTPRIREHLAQQNKEMAYSNFITGLESKSAVAYKLGPFRVDVDSANAPAMGPADAPVTIVEFSDFQCPYCSRVIPSLDKVKENYGDKVRIVFRHFPLNFHQEAQKAAEASLCADDQDKFWEMHNLLFEEQQQLGVDSLKDKAKRLGLDTEDFAACLDSDKHYDQVQEDLQAGVVAGVQGTPAMFINGRFLNGAQPYENIAEIIDEELAKIKG